MGANRLLVAIRRRVLGRQEEEEPSLQLVPPQNCEQHQLVVNLSNNETLRLDYRPEQTVKDVCEQIAKKIQLSPVVLPFFTLVSKTEGHQLRYLNQQKKLSKKECDKEYEFQLVFKACHASRFKEKDIDDKKVIEYFFHQSRQEFLHGLSITFPEKEEKKQFVKLVVLELVYQSRQIVKVKPQKLVDNAKQHKVVHLLRRDIFAEHPVSEVKKYIKSHLKKFEHLTDEHLMLDYLHCIEQSDSFFVHTFTVYKHFQVNDRNYAVEYELIINPHGIKKREKMKDASSQAPEVVIGDFSQVCSLKIEQIENMQVVISRMDSKPEVLYATSAEDAQSIVTIISGYYRLLVNRYKNLVVNSITNMPKIHGPISRQMSESILQAKGEEDGLYLIRHSRKVFGDYVLSLMHNKEIIHYKILKEDGQLALEVNIERKFKKLDALIKHHEESKDGLKACLKKICLPSDTGNDAVLNSHSLVPVIHHPQDLSQFGLECIQALNIKRRDPISKAGEFGKVILSDWTVKEGESPIPVVIRELKKKAYDNSFFEVMKRLLELKNINVIRHHGITQFKDSLGLVIEYAQDNLENYLKNAVSKQQGISRKHVILFAAQIAEGMMYLQNMKCIHGRLRACNVLVATDEQIKIGDIGLFDLQNHGGKFLGVDRQYGSSRYCWHAIEMLIDASLKPTHESDIWSLGVTMWEMFALKKPFHSHSSSKPLSREEILRRYSRRNQYLNTKRENLPEGVANIIQECWKPREEERISFANIVTNLRNLIFQATPEVFESFSKKLILDQEIEDWEKPLEIDKKQQPSNPLKLILENNSYSVMAPVEYDPHCASCLTNPHELVSYGSVVRTRKESLHRTLSDPGSPNHVYEVAAEQLLTQPQHKVSLTRASSFPKAKFFTYNKELISSEQQETPEVQAQKEAGASASIDYVSDFDDLLQPTVGPDRDDTAVEFLRSQHLKALRNHGNTQNKMSQENDNSDVLATSSVEHESAMIFLGNLWQKRENILSSPSYRPSQELIVNPFDPNKPGTVTELPSDSNTSGQYVLHTGMVTPSQSSSDKSGQHVLHTGMVPPSQSGSDRSDQYVLHTGMVTPTQSSSDKSGQYALHTGMVTPSHSGSDKCSQYVLHPGQHTLQPKNNEVLCTEEETSKHIVACRGLQDFVDYYLVNNKNSTGESSVDHPMNTQKGQDNAGYVDENTLSTDTDTTTSGGSPETSEVTTGGWFCNTFPVFSNGYSTQTPVNSSFSNNLTINSEGDQSLHANVLSNPFDPTNDTESESGQPEITQQDTLPPLDKIINEDEGNPQTEMRRAKLHELEKKIDLDFRIPKTNLHIKEVIGSGNFGVVRKGVFIKPKRNRGLSEKIDVAVKELRKCPDEKSQDDFINEAINMQELKKIKNDNIVSPIGICLDTDSEKFMIVTELAPLGDLPKYLQEKKERIGVYKLLDFCLQIANGMMSLESENVLHRDLALRNILVAAEDKVKISDFGLSRLSEYYKARGGKWPMKWYAPESLEKNTFTTKSDVWSYGITMWEIFSYGAKPYPDVDNSQILNHILNGRRLEKPENCPDGVYEIMKQCWKEDSMQRPTFSLLYTSLIPDEIQKLQKDTHFE